MDVINISSDIDSEVHMDENSTLLENQLFPMIRVEIDMNDNEDGRDAEQVDPINISDSESGKNKSGDQQKSRWKKNPRRVKRARRILCKECPGCQAKSCGECKLCNSGKNYLCTTKRCSNLKWENVLVKKHKSIEAAVVDSSEDDRSSVRVIDGISFDFRCTICKIIPRIPCKSELYRHYAMKHFYVQLRKEFGHLKICPFCNLDLPYGHVFHFGQKHNMVEKFLPVEARIPTGVKGSKLSQAREKHIKSRKQVERKVEVEGAEIKLNKNNEDINSNFVEEKINISKHSDDQNLPKASNYFVLSALCKVCKQKFSGVEATVLHIQADHDHHMKGPDNLDDHFQTFLRSGHVVLLPAEDKSVQ